jgi:GNAT superfamily N-acetyltransferase
MALKIESPADEAGLTEFVRFEDRAHEGISARWPAIDMLEMPTLTGQSAVAAGKRMRPFVARENGEIVARSLALVDPAYARRWNDRLGHLAMFEALGGTREAVKQMVDAACEWMKGQGAEAARAGFFMPLDAAFVIDAYDVLPPLLVRQNPDSYHSLLKDAGFECEKGMVDYRIEVTPELVARYQSALEAAQRGGFEVVALADLPPQKRVADFAPAFNEAFYNHWGYVAMPDAAFGEFFTMFEMMGGGLETSAIAYRNGEPVGTVMVMPEQTALAALAPGRKLAEWEKLNFLGIGVRAPARGRGVNLALASFAYLRLIEKGAKYLSYTIVMDDNWPSRRTAEKLGAKVSANYVAYRRNFNR